jgi:hypothetical protein
MTQVAAMIAVSASDACVRGGGSRWCCTKGLPSVGVWSRYTTRSDA